MICQYFFSAAHCAGPRIWISTGRIWSEILTALGWKGMGMRAAVKSHSQSDGLWSHLPSHCSVCGQVLKEIIDILVEVLPQRHVRATRKTNEKRPLSEGPVEW